MAEPKTWIDVADTAVTIGLAALVGGVFSVLLSKMNHERSSKKEYFKRRREIIEKVLEDFDRFSSALSTHWAKLANAVYAHKNSTPELESALAEAEKTQSILWESYRLLLPCQSRLALLGESSCVQSIMAFKEVSDAFFKIAVVGNPKCSIETLEEHKKVIMKARTDFHHRLYEAHSKSA